MMRVVLLFCLLFSGALPCGAAETNDQDRVERERLNGVSMSAIKLMTQGDLDAFRAVVEKEPGVTTYQDPQGASLLHVAALLGDKEVAKYLVNRGAEVTARTSMFGTGKGLLMYSTPMHWAVSAGHIEVVKLMVENGDSLTAMAREGRTSLHIAAHSGQPAMIRFLADEGLDVGAKERVNHRRPLHYAAREGHTEAAIALLETGADANARTFRDATPLHFAAASRGTPETVKALLKHGADPGAKDQAGKTALDYATSKGRSEVVELLTQEP